MKIACGEPSRTMDCSLRPCEPTDFATLYAIDQECYPAGIAYSDRTLRWFLRLPGADCLIAEVGKHVVGFILAEHEGPRAHIITLDVLLPYRRHGIGSALLSAIEQRLAARGARQVQLETATDNLAAVAFWQKHGYRTRGLLKRYYLGRLDAFWMEKSLAVS